MNRLLLDQFFEQNNSNGYELYNEAGLQHELAIYLRNALPDHYVRLEYPITRVFRPLQPFRKKEMDIYITDNEGRKYLIELKVPRENCGAPKEMFHAIEDVKFAEELRSSGFTSCYCILITERSSFWLAPQADSGIYFRFNGEEVNISSIENTDLPDFLMKKGAISLNQTYIATWNPFQDAHNVQWKYYIMEV